MTKVLGALLGACLLVTACTSTSNGDADGGPEVGSGDRASVDDLLDWDAPTVDGGELDARAYDGQPVAFWFWAPWCPTCNATASDVVAATSDLPAGVTVLGVAGRDDVGPMERFEAEHGLGFPSAVDADGSIWTRFGVRGQPTWVFVAADGTSELVAGAITEDELRDRLAALAAS